MQRALALSTARTKIDDPELARLARSGGGPDADALRAGVRALAPDLIVTQTQCEVCAVSLRDVEEALRRLVGSRPEVVALQPDSLTDVWRDMRRVSEALGVPERGVQLVTRLQRHMRGIAERARENAPAHAIHPEAPIFDVGWLCPFCGRNTLSIAGCWE